MNWSATAFVLPKEGVKVHTKIMDSNGTRCEQKMTLKKGLWFCEDGTYVYYAPTHWAYIE